MATNGDDGQDRMTLSLGQLRHDVGACLQQAGIDQPRYEAALILSHFLGITLAKVYAESGTPVSRELLDRIWSAARRRAGHEPLAYIFGETEFYGRLFLVGPGVLIPRPDSEILVERGLAACRQMALPDRPIMILDACAGTGCIGISVVAHLLREGRDARLWLTELDPAAAGYTRKNLMRHDLADRSTLEIADLFPQDPGLTWDLILANPPYIATAVIASLMPEVCGHEPQIALDGGPDGLSLYRRLISGAAERLYPGGCLLMEHGFDQSEAISELIRADGRYEQIATAFDYGGQPRVTGGRRYGQSGGENAG